MQEEVITLATWEYTVVNLSGGEYRGNFSEGHEKDQRILNELGRQGWELVSVTAFGTDYSGGHPTMYLKRQRA